MSTKKKKTIHVMTKAPGQPPVEVDIEANLETLQSAVGGLVEVFGDDDLPGVDIWLNEEGKIYGLANNLKVPGDILCGSVVFARVDRDGHTASLKASDIQAIVAWCERRAI